MEKRPKTQQVSASDVRLLKAVCENSSSALFVLNEKQHCIYMNPAATALTGYAPEEIQTRALHEMIHHSRPDGSAYPIKECQIFQAFATSRRHQGQDTFIHKDGRFYNVAFTASPIEEGGVVVGTVLEVRDISADVRARQALEEETWTLELLNRIGKMLISTLDLEEIVQTVTDTATELSGAQVGAFFYNAIREGKALQLYTLSGAPRSAFSSFPPPRHTAVFGPTFAGGSVLRVGNIKADPRYGIYAPFHGMPQGHLPVTSYLAVPVISRAGDILGALIFGHEEANVFSARSERIVTAIAAQASIAIDNANLFEAAQREIADRQRSEDHQKLLAQELNHRVKNMLATVQAIAKQTFRGRAEGTAMRLFTGRLLALSHSHSLIMQENWRSVDLKAIASASLTPFVGDIAGNNRILLKGHQVSLTPKLALALGMGFHELATNATKYGALKFEEGQVEIRWQDIDDDTLCITWVEKHGPVVKPPPSRGFGTRLLEEGLSNEIAGTVRLLYDPNGLICEIRMPISETG